MVTVVVTEDVVLSVVEVSSVDVLDEAVSVVVNVVFVEDVIVVVVVVEDTVEDVTVVVVVVSFGADVVVCSSPLLSVHVMTVMCAYALFALQLLLGVQAFLLIRKKRNDELERVTALSQLLLYPAVFLLAIGIFLGAVWANVSWGNYWSWDPKETWALITLMVYAVPFHGTSIPLFRRPLSYHLYMVCAFLSVVITYFGVNYLLGGMHSYV